MIKLYGPGSNPQMFSLVDRVIIYYQTRGLVWPKDADTALKWLITELGEVFELLLDREDDWVRNNPESKEAFDKRKLAEELGDVILMAVVAGIVEQVDPVSAMLEKMERKEREHGNL